MKNGVSMTNYKDNFNKFGFLVLRDVFTKEQCDDFKSSIVKFYFGENGESRNYYAPNYRNGKETVCPLAFNFTELEDLLDIFDNQKLIEINEIIRNHPVEVIGKELRGSMTAMKKLV